MFIETGQKSNRPDVETLRTIRQVVSEIDDFDNVRCTVENFLNVLDVTIRVIEHEIETDKKGGEA